jgi:hypothetical protein
LSRHPPKATRRQSREDIQLAVVEIVLCTLGEAEQEHRKISRPIGDHHSITAPPPLPFPRHTLLDEAAAEIGIHQPRAARSIASPRLSSEMSSLRAKRAKVLSLYIATNPHWFNEL